MDQDLILKGFLLCIFWALQVMMCEQISCAKKLENVYFSVGILTLSNSFFSVAYDNFSMLK